jgi:hypothetical protein
MYNRSIAVSYRFIFFIVLFLAVSVIPLKDIDAETLQLKPDSIKLNLPNSPPDTFSLISPTDLDSVKTPFLLDWEASADPDPNDTLFYDVYVNLSMVFDSASWEHIYALSEIPAESLDTGLWYWTVRAYDTWGAETWANDTSSFYVYLCGDFNGDGQISIADVIYEINFLFKGGVRPIPYKAGDANCNGHVTVSDAVYLLNYLFIGGPLPCDPTDDGVPDC